MQKKKQESKKKYQPPHLIRYGNFKKLTLGTRSRNNDTQNQAGTNKTRSSTS